MQLKHYIILLTFYFSLPALKAQNYLISQGISYHYFTSNSSADSKNEFDIGYQFYFEYAYKTKRDFKMKVLAGFSHINSGYYTGGSSFFDEFSQSVHINASYLVLGWRPVNFNLFDNKMEVGLGFDLYSRVEDRTVARESYKNSSGLYYPGPVGVNQYDGFVEGITYSGNFSVGLELSYPIKFKSPLTLVPRITYRRVKLVDFDVEASNIVGAEIGFSF